MGEKDINRFIKAQEKYYEDVFSEINKEEN